MRAQAVGIIRRHMEAAGFVDIETPIMGKPTPEGARDFLLPSRLQPAASSRCPQSPQIYKQLLVISGFERYYQIARCFRDEDLRADRLQELTQLDVEMAFPDREVPLRSDRGDVRRGLARVPRSRSRPALAADDLGRGRPSVRLGQARPALRARDPGRDRGDTRRRSSASSQNAPAVRFLVAPQAFSRGELTKLEELAKEWGAKGLAYLVVDEAGEVRSPIAKFLSEPELEAFRAEPGSTVLFGAGEPALVSRVLGALRLHLGRELGLVDETSWKFLWVTDFPLLEWSEEESRWTAVHHPFTRPTPEGEALLDSDPGAATA